MRHNRDLRHRIQEIDAGVVKGIAGAVVHNERRINGHYYAIQRPCGNIYLAGFQAANCFGNTRVRSL